MTRPLSVKFTRLLLAPTPPRALPLRPVDVELVQAILSLPLLLGAGLDGLALALLDLVDQSAELLLAVLPERRDLLDIHLGDVRAVPAQHLVARHGRRRHGEAHVPLAVDQLQDRAGRLVGPVLGLGPQHARVAARAVEVAFSQLAEELGEEGVWCLYVGSAERPLSA